MGCDIHSFVEVKDKSGKWNYCNPKLKKYSEYDRECFKKDYGRSEPFDWRNYGMFGLLADVRNYSHVPVISEPKGTPDDWSDEVKEKYGDDNEYHSASYLTVQELLAFNYDQVFWDRRVTKQEASGIWNGASLAEEGEGEHLTIREFLGDSFFEDLKALEALGNPEDVRIVFWFDN